MGLLLFDDLWKLPNNYSMSSTKTSLSTLSDNKIKVKSKQVNKLSKLAEKQANTLLNNLKYKTTDSGLFEYKYKNRAKKQSSQTMYKPSYVIYTTLQELADSFGWSKYKVKKHLNYLDENERLKWSNHYEVDRKKHLSKRVIGVRITLINHTKFFYHQSSDVHNEKCQTVYDNSTVSTSTPDTPISSRKPLAETNRVNSSLRSSHRKKENIENIDIELLAPNIRTDNSQFQSLPLEKNPNSSTKTEELVSETKKSTKAQTELLEAFEILKKQNYDAKFTNTVIKYCKNPTAIKNFIYRVKSYKYPVEDYYAHFTYLTGTSIGTKVGNPPINYI
jgi:hypothetical protein